MTRYGVQLALLGVSAIFMGGWIVGHPFQFGPVSQKFSTAFCFHLAGWILLLETRHARGPEGIASSERAEERGQIVVAIMALVILAVMAGMLIGHQFLGIPTEIPALWGVTESPGAEGTVRPGEPSVGTMVAFSVFAGGRLLQLLTPRTILWPARIIGAIATVALFGHLTGVPALYYYWPSISTGMAWPTAALLALMALYRLRFAPDWQVLSLLLVGVLKR